jgi:hypothetical protein
MQRSVATMLQSTHSFLRNCSKHSTEHTTGCLRNTPIYTTMQASLQHQADTQSLSHSRSIMPRWLLLQQYPVGYTQTKTCRSVFCSSAGQPCVCVCVSPLQHINNATTNAVSHTFPSSCYSKNGSRTPPPLITTSLYNPKDGNNPWLSAMLPPQDHD